MQKRSKRYKQAAAMVTAGKVYSLEEAITLIQNFPTVKFNQTVTVSFHMGVDPKKSELMVRGTCPLPHGSGKSVRVLVFAQGNAADASRAAGAEYVGYEDMIAKIKEGFVDFDVAIATPEAMTEVRKLGKQLGPRGLMPNPRTGTVTDDPVAAIKAVKAGRADFKLDKNGNIAAGVGKVSFSVNQLVDNATSFIEAVNRARPAAAKGRFLLSCTLTATMSPGLPVDISKFVKI